MMVSRTSKMVFLDKDGTLVENVPYSASPADIHWYDDAFESMARMQAAGYGLVVVTNQAGIARGKITEEQVQRYLQVLIGQAAEAGIVISAALYCPHHPGAIVSKYRRYCSCRKPSPGMLSEAARRFRVDLSQSWMIGDILDDVEAGSRAGASTVLVDRLADQDLPGYGFRRPDFVVSTLTQAADQIASFAKVAV